MRHTLFSLDSEYVISLLVVCEKDMMNTAMRLTAIARKKETDCEEREVSRKGETKRRQAALF